jgi:hypothetical protein
VNLPVAELQDSRQPKKQIIFIVPKIVELASTGPLFRGNGPDAVAYYAPRASRWSANYVIFYREQMPQRDFDRRPSNATETA